jgi:hypothetical protein
LVLQILSFLGLTPQALRFRLLRRLNNQDSAAQKFQLVLTQIEFLLRVTLLSGLNQPKPHQSQRLFSAYSILAVSKPFPRQALDFGGPYVPTKRFNSPSRS